MLGLTRKPTTTKCVEVTYRVPVRFLGKAKRFLATLGAEESSDSVSWRDVFPKFNATVALRGARKKEGLTQKQLADLLEISQTHISQLEHGKRPIGKKMAHRLAEILDVDYRAFL